MTFPESAYSVPVIFFKFFKKIAKTKDPKYRISLKRYRNIVYLFNKKLLQALLKGKIIELPYDLGNLRIKKKPLNIEVAKLNVPLYMKTGEKTRYYNEHSEGFRAAFYWQKEKCSVAGSYMFAFESTKTNKQALSAIMKKDGGHKTFLE